MTTRPRRKAVPEFHIGNLRTRDDSEKLSTLMADFLMVFAHSVYCRYTNSEAVQTVHLAPPFFFRRSLDPHVVDYIEKSVKSVKRWLQHQRLAEMKAFFVDAEGRAVVLYRVNVYAVKGGGMARRFHHFKEAYKRLKVDLCELLLDLEKSPKWPVPENALNQFKLSFRFQEHISIAKRPDEHRWRKAKPFVPCSNEPCFSENLPKLPERSLQLFNMRINRVFFPPTPSEQAEDESTVA